MPNDDSSPPLLPGPRPLTQTVAAIPAFLVAATLLFAWATCGECQRVDDGVAQSATAHGDGPPPVGPPPPVSQCREDRDCDDRQSCTTDRCEDGGRCSHVPRRTVACLPQLTVEAPPRDALQRGDAGEAVTVRGRVEIPHGGLAEATLNGASLPIDDSGVFEVSMAAQIGSNPIAIRIRDGHGRTTEHRQSMTLAADTIAEGGFDDAIRVRLAQAGLDDGSRRGPDIDVASWLEAALVDGELLAKLAPTQAVAKAAGYAVFVDKVRVGDATVRLKFIEDGIHVEASARRVSGALRFVCGGGACTVTGGDSTGRFKLASLDVVGDVVLLEGSGKTSLATRKVSVDLGKLSLSSKTSWTHAMLAAARSRIATRAAAAIEDEITTQVALALARAGGIAGLQSRSALSLGPAPGGPVIELQLRPHGLSAVGSPDGAATLDFGVVLVPGALPLAVPTVARRTGCTDDAGLSLPRRGPLEVGLADDLLAYLIHAGWQRGLLDFSLSAPAAQVTAIAAPVVSDCHPEGGLHAVFGDLRTEGADFVAHSTVTLALTVHADAEGLRVAADTVTAIDTAITPTTALGLARRDAHRQAIDGSLPDALRRQLGGSSLLTVPWPELGASPLPVPRFSPQGVARRRGLTAIRGDLTLPAP